MSLAQASASQRSLEDRMLRHDALPTRLLHRRVRRALRSNTMGIRALLRSLFGQKPDSPGGESPSLAIVHTIHRNVDFMTLLGTLEPASVAHMEVSTVPPCWDGTQSLEAPRGFTLPPPGSYAIAVVDVASTGLPGGRSQFLSVFYADDDRQFTRRWKAERPWRPWGRKPIRALFMLPPEAVSGETKVMSSDQA
jgi:hypothetical protein